MENLPQKKKDILFASHLEEVDDLDKWGRNAPLAETEKNKENLNQVADEIARRIRVTGKKLVMFVTSPRTRAKETARLVAKEIERKLDGSIKIRYSNDENLKAPEQGKFILPEGYTAGSFFEGLSIASKIFTDESLESDNKNLNYRFGDPLLQEDGSYKYPELATYFKASGETYAQSLIRIFDSVVQLSSKVDKLDKNTELVLVSHGFNFHILRGLSILAEDIKSGKVALNTGDIAHHIWSIYKSNTINFKDLSYVPIDITNLGDRELIDFLSKEIEFLQSKQ